MKELQTRSTATVATPITMPGATKVTTKREVTESARYTLRVEEGVIQINNISGTPEGVTYTLMAQRPDGSTELITRHVALAPFQVVEDQPDGMNVLAAWTKN